MLASVKNSSAFFAKFLASALLITIFTACSSENNVDRTPSLTGDIKDVASWYALPTDSRMDVIDSNITIYGYNSTLANMQVSIPVPNSNYCVPWDDLTAAPRPCTLDDVDHDIDGEDNYEPYLISTLSTGGFVGLGEFKIRGNYTRTLDEKSYSFKLNSEAGLLDYQQKYQFNKHLSDSTRIKNKLAFDLFRTIPNFTSLKTQFVHLYVKEGSNTPVDYGLFTHIEAMGEEYLTNRGWNPDDNLYNANSFQFDEWAMENLIVDEDGKPINEENFEEFLEIKAGKNHSMVTKMLAAVNSDQDIDNVVATYFNRQNYLTWMAINLLLCNQDVSYHNFYLYNPLYSTKFYFLPWDYDGAWTSIQYLGKAEYGIAVLMQVPLHRKFLSKQKNRDDLYAMADYLRANYITNAHMQELIDSYEYPISQAEYVSSWRSRAQTLITKMDDNIALYKSVIGDPMPYYEYASYNAQTKEFYAHWDESVDFEGDPIVYDLKLGTDYDQNNTVINVSGINDLNYTQTIDLPAGTYYLKVTSREENNASHYQEAFNRFETDSKTVYGTVTFDVQ